MKNCIVKDKKIQVVCGGEVVTFTIVPMTFLKLLEINEAVFDGNGKDLNSVLKNPTPLDTAKILYALLNKQSREILKKIELQIDSEEEEPTPAQKLFYLLSKTNIADGLQNYASVLDGVTKQVIDSTQESETKKKRVLHLPIPMFWNWKKSTI